MKRKFWFRRLSISAPKMMVKSQLPWPMRFVFWVVVLGLAGAIALWAYDLGRNFAGFGPNVGAQVELLDHRVKQLELERDRLISQVNATESEINIERAAQKPLREQITALESEKTKLKEDLSFFEGLLPANTGSKGISIQRLALERVAVNQVRYRMLVMQGGNGKHEFTGDLQFSATVLQDGKSAMISFPKDKSTDSEKYKLSFKHYQRLDGVLVLPEGAAIKSVQARVLERGQVRAQQSASL